MSKILDNKSSEKKAEIEIAEELIELEEDLKSLNPDIFKGVGEKKKLEILRSISFVSIQQRSHSGPLPDAETLIQYNSVIPNGADRIMKMAENQQNHRMKMEEKVITSQTNQSKLGQIFGLIIGLIGIGCGTFLAAKGEVVVGGVIAGATVVSLVSVFVLGRNSQKRSQTKN